MLHFILGRVCAGKTTYLHKLLGERLKSSDKNAVLIVPEQFTFETDRGILDSLGAVLGNRVDVYSFTRLARAFIEENHIEQNEILSEQGRLLYMSQAIKAVRENLSVYRSQIDKPAFIKGMLLVVDELKQSSSGREKLSESVASLPEGLMKEKIKELILICDTYDALISEKYVDTSDTLDVFGKSLVKASWLKGRTVAIDGFSSFNGQIMKIIEQIMLASEDLYITLTADGISYFEGESDAFAFVRRTASRLKVLANRNGVKIAPPVIINEETTGYFPYSSEYLYHLEQNFMQVDYEVKEGKTDSVNIFCSNNIEDECAFIAREILKLTRKGYRLRDMAVIYRDAEQYENELKYAFKKYAVPFFEDKREPILNQPPVLLMLEALKICAEGYRTENILRYLKTGISPLNQEEISQLENYVYLWQIDGNKWLSEWTDNPEGFTEKKIDSQWLQKINSHRQKAVTALQKLKESIKNKTGREISEGLYNFLVETDVRARLLDLAVDLEQMGEITLAAEQGQVWDLMMEMINTCANVLGDTVLSINEYANLFELSVSGYTLGKIPNGIDDVIIGSADRIKIRNTKICFVCGLNMGDFPAGFSSSGIITDRDRGILLKAGIELFDTANYKALGESFISYNAVCCPRDRVYLSYCMKGKGDEKKRPGEIISSVRKILPDCTFITSEDISVTDRIEGVTSAFEIFAEKYQAEDYYTDNLYEFFSKKAEYKDLMKSLERVTDDGEIAFRDSDNAVKLFGKNMYISASKAEVYESCPFRYFCQYGIKAYPRKKARLDPASSGTIIHHVLEKLMRRYRDTGLQNVENQALKQDIRSILNEYAESFLGGLDDKNSRFLYHLERIARVLDVLFERLKNELSDCSFIPCDFELKIGRDEAIPCYEVELADGGKILINGSVDRVDIMKTEDRSYIRVIDYKSGQKKMELSDVLNGLNMQMLIYLFAIGKNGGEYYKNKLTPAGVLYFPARFVPYNTNRHLNDDEIKEIIIDEGKMNGLVLADTRVVKGMEESAGGRLIPAKIDENGYVKGSIISLKQMERLNEKIDGILREMGENLHRGKIPVSPVYGKGHDDVCEYCDYQSVCLKREDTPKRYIEFLKHEECLERLEGENENG